MNFVKFLSARYFLIAYGAIALFILSPLAVVLFANVLANIASCPEGVQYSNGVCTNGDILYALSQAGWLLVFTLPVGLIFLGAIIFLNVLLYLVIKKRALLASYVINRIRRRFFSRG